MEPPSDESRGTWWTKRFDCRDDPVDRLCTLAKQVFDLWDNPTPGLTDRAVIDVAEQDQPPMISA